MALVLVELLLLVPLAAGVLLEHAARGITTELLALAALLAPAHLRRLAAIFGLVRSRGEDGSAGFPGLVAEIAALAGIACYPVAPWALVAAALAAVAHAGGSPRSERVSRALTLLAVGVAAVAVLGLASGFEAVPVRARLLGEPRVSAATAALVAGPWASLVLLLSRRVREPVELRATGEGLARALRVGATSVAALALAWDVVHGRAFADARLLLFLPFALESVRRKGPAAALEHVAGCALVVGATVSREWALEGPLALALAVLPARIAVADALAPGPLASAPRARAIARLAWGALAVGALAWVIEPGLARVAWLAFAVVALVAWRARALAEPSPRARAGLAVALGIAIACGFARAPSWDEVEIEPDTPSYWNAESIRLPLYTSFLAATVSGERPAASASLDDFANQPRRRPDDPFRPAVRVQKLLVAAAIALLVWALALELPFFWLVALVHAALAYDLARTHADANASIAINAGCAISEGLNHALVFAHLAALVLYLRNPRPRLAVALGTTLALLLLNRPANMSLAAVVGAVALFHAGRGERRVALARAAIVVAVGVLPLVGVAAANEALVGYFRPHAFGGWGEIGVGLQVATPEDVDAFDDPRLREFARICIVENAAKCADYRVDFARSMDVKIFDVAMPAFARVYRVPPGTDLEHAENDVWSKVGATLMARHKRAVLERALYAAWLAFDPFVHLAALAAIVAGAIAWARTRDPRMLFAVYAAALPFVYMAPACLINQPLPRFRSQLVLFELGAAALVAGVLARENTPRPCRSDNGESAPRAA